MRFDGLVGLLTKLEALPKGHKFGEVRVFLGPPTSYNAVFSRTTLCSEIPSDIQAALSKVTDYFKGISLEIVCDDKGQPRKVLSTHMDF